MTIANFDKASLQQYVDRIENINGDIDNLTADRGEVYASAKASGFDEKIIRLCIADRKKRRKDAAKHKETGDLFELYSDNLDDPA